MVRHNPFKKILRVLNIWLLRLHRLAIRFPKSTLGVLAVVLIASLVVLPKLRMQMSIDELVDKDFTTYTQLRELKHHYDDQDEIFLIVRPATDRIPSKREICSVGAWMQNLVDSRGDLRAITSTLGVARPIESSSSFSVKPLLAPDCTNLDDDEVAAIAKGFQKVVASPFKGTLTADDGKDLAVLIYPSARVQASSLAGSFNSKLVDEIQSSFKEQVLDRHPELRASWTGDGIFQYHLHRGYERMPILNLLMSLLILIAFRFFFGTFMSGILFLLTVFWTSLPLYAGMALAGHPIDVLSSSLSLMIFVAAIEDYIFLTHFMRRWSWRRAYPRVLLPSFFTSLTTSIGFGSLMLADLGIIRRFGLWAGVGSLLEWVFIFVALPALVVTFPRLQKWVLPKKSYLPQPKWLLEFHPSKIITLLMLMVFPLGYWATKGLYVTDSPERLLKPSHETRQALDVVEKTRGWRAQVSLVFADHRAETFNRSVIDQVSKFPTVEQIEDPYSVVKYLTENLSESMKGVTKEGLSGTMIGRRLGPRAGQSRALLYVKDLEINDVNKMRHDVLAMCPKGECWLAGSLVSYGELGERILGTLYDSLSGSLIFVSIVILLLSLAYRPKDFPALVLSSLWGPAALLLFFYVFKIPIFYVTSMIASIVVGLAGDNAIQFMLFSNKRRSLQRSVTDVGPAALMVTISTILASTVFFFGYFDPMRLLGLMMIVGLALAFIGDVLVLRGLSKDA